MSKTVLLEVKTASATLRSIVPEALNALSSRALTDLK